MGRLAGKTAIITGASQGMGAAHARAFLYEGANTVLTDLNPPREPLNLGAKALFIELDVRDETQWAAVIKITEKKFGPVGVLINNAGIVGPLSDTLELTAEAFLAVCAVNQLGVFLGMRAVIPSMIAAGGGSIVNVSSIGGMLGLDASANLAYVASKFAVRGMTKLAARRHGKNNIRVNSVHPGFIKTPMMVAATHMEGGGAILDIPLGRIGNPEEVSNLMVFLASDESSFISGTEHVIDGGMIAG